MAFRFVSAREGLLDLAAGSDVIRFDFTSTKRRYLFSKPVVQQTQLEG